MVCPNVTTSLSMGLIAGMLAICAPENALANPEVDVTDSAVDMQEGGRQVKASFSGWDDAEYYNDRVYVLWLSEQGWRAHSGTWNTVEDPESPKDTFFRFIPCPGPGKYKFLLMENYSDELGEPFRELVIRNMECVGAGPLIKGVFGDPITLGPDDEGDEVDEVDESDKEEDDSSDGAIGIHSDESSACSVSEVGAASSSAGFLLIVLGTLLFRRRRN